MEHNKEFMKNVALNIIFLNQQKPTYVALQHHNTGGNWEVTSVWSPSI